MDIADMCEKFNKSTDSLLLKKRADSKNHFFIVSRGVTITEHQCHSEY